MGFLKNEWVSYVERSYQQIKTAVLLNMQSRVAEITDHSENNIFVKMVSIWAGISEMIGYYVDNAAREAHLESARLYKSAVSFAEGNDYRIKGFGQASVMLKFSINEAQASPLTIPLYTEVETEDGIKFRTTASGQINTGALFVYIAAEQVEAVTEEAMGTSNGSALQEYAFENNVVEGSLVVKVNNIAWTRKDTLAYSPNTGEHYITSVNRDKKVIVRFGDGTAGKIPPSSQAIKADYKKTSGSLGNVGVGTITTVNTEVTVPTGVVLSVTNEERASGGVNVESLASLKVNIPKANRTQLRAVGDDDYRDVIELATGVERAGIIFGCGKKVKAYIIPSGGGIASDVLIASVDAWMLKKKMITTKLDVFSAGEVRVILNINVVVRPQFVKDDVLAVLMSRLTEFLSYQNQEISGSVQLSDIYEIIETTTGVQSSVVNQMSPVPYARPTASDTPALVWTRSINIGSVGEVSWRIQMLSGTSFSLFRNNVYVGAYATGVVITLTEITFSVTASSYTINQEWEFKTYRYNGSIILNEPSIAVSLEADVTLNGEGGL